jgi:hypothetical protein
MVNIVRISETQLISGFEIKEDNIFVQEKIFSGFRFDRTSGAECALHTGYKYFS